MSHAVSPVSPVLKVFPDQQVDLQSGQILVEQLPFLENLRREVESITGWQIDYAESTHSFQTRKTEGNRTVLGSLAIEDMSFNLLPGQRPVPRYQVEYLVQTLDRMLGKIQSDRLAMEDFSKTLSRVVRPPLPYWTCRGVAGCRLGELVCCAAGDQSQVYVLAARFDGSSELEMIHASRNLKSVFEAGVMAGLNADRLLSMLDFNLSNSLDTVKFPGFVFLEFAPDQEQFQIHSVGSAPSAVLADMNSGCTFSVDAVGGEGSLEPHQAIILDTSQHDSISDWIHQRASSELDLKALADRLNHQALDAPCVGVFRT